MPRKRKRSSLPYRPEPEQILDGTTPPEYGTFTPQAPYGEQPPGSDAD